MVKVALAGWLIYLAVGAGWRSWLQKRLTGDHGFRGLAAPLGSPEQLGGAALVVGAVVSVAAPVLVLTGTIDTWHVLESPALAMLGLVLFVMGLGVTIRAQLDMGASWRIGVDRSERTALATGGLYTHTRNPIYSGMLVVWVAEALLVPSAVSLCGLALTFAAIEVFIRRIEEPHLLAVHGESYRAYARSVGRFLPRVGLL